MLNWPLPLKRFDFLPRPPQPFKRFEPEAEPCRNQFWNLGVSESRCLGSQTMGVSIPSNSFRKILSRRLEQMEPKDEHRRYSKQMNGVMMACGGLLAFSVRCAQASPEEAVLSGSRGVSCASEERVRAFAGRPSCCARMRMSQKGIYENSIGFLWATCCLATCALGTWDGA